MIHHAVAVNAAPLVMEVEVRLKVKVKRRRRFQGYFNPGITTSITGTSGHDGR